MSTKTWKKKYLPTHCPIPAAKVKVTDTDFEVFDSMALCEQIVSIDVNVQIERVVASISDTIKYYRGICSGLHSHLYFMGGIFTERGIDFMTAEEYRALLDTDFSDVKINEMPDMASYHADLNDTIEKRQQKFIRKV